jgi:hypothetical protein
VTDETIETFAVLVAEWIIGDDGVRVRLGDRIDWEVRPSDDEDDGPFAQRIEQDRAEAGQPALLIFVRHADDPEPPVDVTGRVVAVQALRWADPPEGRLTLVSQPLVSEAWIDPDVGDYLVHVEGTISWRR